jgi:dihydrodipicolinate synthase/N-acetylneuraminate lyase
MSEQKFKGVIISPLTPFTKEGKLDEAVLENLIEFYISKGVGGILALATAGQGPLISVEERKRIAEIILKKCRNRLPVMVQAGALTTRETIELAEHACSLGADAIASLPPLYARLDFAAYEQHYQAISSAISPVPLFVYNNPWAQGRALTPEELVYLNEKNYIKGVVDSSRDLGSVYKLLSYKDKLTCIIADTKLSMPGILFGCPALATAIGNAIPELFVEMFNAVKENNISKAVELELKVFKISESLRTPEIGALHEALAARGLPCGIPRLPVRMPSEKEKEIIRNAMKVYTY